MKVIFIFTLSIFSGFTQYNDYKEVNFIDRTNLEVWNTVKEINRHWAITENMDSLALCLHNEMVIFYPDRKERLVGKDSILQSYRKYTQYAETISMEETEPLVQLYNDNKTAIVTYYNDLKIKTQDGDIQSFRCKDMYTLIYENGRWYAVAQHYSFYE
ncbi:MAG: nuclear transport factor 2 family protein [Prevotella sp.]|jgi:ketosteroid isomerase-like protein|nr:nuclear transport factor 2 family protein [Prevotella sp.]